MTNVGKQFSDAIGKSMMKAASDNYNKHKDIDTISDLSMKTSQFQKDIKKVDTSEQEMKDEGKNEMKSKGDFDQEISSDLLTKIFKKIVKDLDDDEKQKLNKNNRSKEESKEATGASSAGGYVAPLFGKPQKRKIKEDSDGETIEATTSSSVGVYDAPIGGGRRDPLKIDTPENVYSKLRSVKDKNFPKYGGKGGKYVKVKKKCSKYPYCNQGDIKALEFFEKVNEIFNNKNLIEAIRRVSKKYKIDETYIKSIILERLVK